MGVLVGSRRSMSVTRGCHAMSASEGHTGQATSVVAASSRVVFVEWGTILVLEIKILVHSVVSNSQQICISIDG